MKTRTRVQLACALLCSSFLLSSADVQTKEVHEGLERYVDLVDLINVEFFFDDGLQWDLDLGIEPPIERELDFVGVLVSTGFELDNRHPVLDFAIGLIGVATQFLVVTVQLYITKQHIRIELWFLFCPGRRFFLH
ncbi:hypothetical protein GGR56DRAFT_678420 [Xylariaceae sp. FL0804]|nr:hypothetical protein GGR56DRAFT_678420 [Xylariaceae sp. FL0804]